ncbi:hypothetical protein MXAZACID_17451 [Acidocella sp. MX-AZ02]|nr:hypothetical protein MXAZACID_17451 [Acidocella sp. MX-AZ02]
MPHRVAAAFASRSMIIPFQPQKPPCLLSHIPKLSQAAAFPDQIQQIAMRALGGILLMCSYT